MAYRTLSSGEPGANPDDEHVSPRNIEDDAGQRKGGTPKRGETPMNMMTQIQPQQAREAAAAVDDYRMIPERVGPDLREAEPIEEVIARLKQARSTYSVQFYNACKDSGIDLHANYLRDGDERLCMGFPMDDQEELRQPRFDALRKHVTSTPKRRQSVLDLLNMLGMFVDNRPYSSIKEAVDLLLEAGGRVYILQDGTVEHAVPMNRRALMEEGWHCYPLRRLYQRFQATAFRNRVQREELTNLIKQRGKLHEPSGAVVLRSDQ